MRARRANAGDVASICHICADGWRDTYVGLYAPEEIERVIAEFYVPERVVEELEPGEGWDGWWVAEDEGGEVVAAGGGGLTAPGVGEVFVLYADPRRRGEGAGTVLLESLSAEQRSRGVREQWVSVEPENDKGLPFYFARGFVEREKQPAFRREGAVSLRLSRPI